MVRPYLLALLVVSLAVGSTGCIRSPSEVEAPGEGGLVSGAVLVLDPVTGRPAPRPGVEATLIELGQTVRTDVDGRFRFDRIPIGRWRVRLFQPEDADRITRERLLDPFEVFVDGQTVELGNLELRDSGGLAGVVLTRPEAGALETPPGTLVVLAETAFRAVTNSNGAYLLPEAPEGSFSLLAFRAGFAPGRVGIEVKPGSIETVSDLVLTPGMTPTTEVNGEVLLPPGLSPDNVAVEFLNIQDPSIRLGALSNDAGGFTVADVPVGPYSVTFAKDGFVSVLLEGVAVLPEATVGLRRVRMRPRPDGDLDGDGIPNDEDDDRDNDGCPDSLDDFPDDPFACGDTDGDGVDDLFDEDDDADTLSDAEELSPGADGFVTDPLRRDTDLDGFEDDEDLCPLTPSELNDPAECTPIDPIDIRDRPLITEIRPTVGRVGDVLEVIGRNFVPGPFTLVRFGAAGAVVEVATASVGVERIAVRVPVGATTGPIFVVNAQRSVTSSQTFTFLAPPDPQRFVPTAGRLGDGVVLFGDEFENVRSVSIGSAPVVLQDCDPSLQVPAGLTALCFNVPPGATTAPIIVTSDNGRTSTVEPFQVLSGPVIRALVPPVTPPDSIVRLIGEGFSGPASVNVLFGGGGSATSESLSDGEIRVRVPANAVTGVVTVEHPSGNAISLDPLFVDNLVPAVIDMFPSLAMVGETIRFSGVNLGAATEVEFPGGVRVPAQNPNNGRLEAVAPNNLQPGQVYVHFPNSVTATAPIGLSVLDMVQLPNVSINALGALTNPPQTEITFFYQNGDAEVRDASTLMFLRQRSILPGQVQSAGTTNVWASLAGNRAVLYGLRAVGNVRFQTLYTLDPVTLRTEFDCDILPWVQDMVFFGDRAFYIANLTGLGFVLVQFDLRTGECSPVNEAGGGIPLQAMYYAGQGLLHVYAASSGEGVVDIDPNRPTFGTYTRQPVGGTSPTGQGGWAWFGLGSNDVYLNSGTLYRFQRLTATTSPITLRTSVPSVRPLISFDGRWTVIGQYSMDDIVFDNLRGVVAREGRIGDTPRGATVVGDQGVPRFILYQSGNGVQGLARFDVRGDGP